MQRILERIKYGFFYYQNGFVAPEKVQKLIDKFTELYAINGSSNQNYYRKSKGLANSFFTCYPISKSGKTVFIWFLMCTDGKGNIHELEKLKDLRNRSNKLNWNHEYEIAKISSKGVETNYTWRLTSQNYDSWKVRIKESVREHKNNTLLKQCIWSLRRTPGFRGNREQTKELFLFLIKEVRRRKSKSYLIDDIKPYIGYAQRLKNNFVPIELAIENIKKGERFDKGLRK